MGLLIVGALFYPALTGQEILAFRDAAYWHSNTLEWTAEELQAGRVPLWNDLQGLGCNWVAQGTTTVFYPGTWLLAIDLGSFSQRYAAVIALHLILSGWGMYRFGVALKLPPHSAWIAAFSFALSGPILVQHANWPFLISATWMPWALCGLWQALVLQKRAGSLAAAAALALIVLGGEPQAVILWLIASLILVAWHSVTRECVFFTWQWTKRLGRGIFLVAGIVTWALAASCVQWWPMLETTPSSTRTLRSEPANLYQAAPLWWTGTTQDRDAVTRGLLGPPQPGSQKDQSLQFSQPPWQWATLWTGNLLGTWRSTHARWDRHLPANDRVWNPTLYAGALIAILVVSLICRSLHVSLRWCRLKRRGRRLWRRIHNKRIEKVDNEEDNKEEQAHESLAVKWLLSLLVFFALASCGWYGAVWLTVEVQNAMGVAVPTPAWGPQVGGLYWLLTLVWPGFELFRYPAKMWLVAAVAWSLLAAIELNRAVPTVSGCNSKLPCSDRARRRVQLTLTGALFVLTVAFGVSVSPWFIQYFYRAFQAATPDMWLGALNLPQALLEFHLSFVQTIVVCSLVLGGFWAANGCRGQVLFSAGLLLLTAFDLWVANAWIVQTVDSRVLRDQTIWDSPESPYRSAKVDSLTVGQHRFWHDPQLMQQHRLWQMQSKWGDYWTMQPTEKLTWQAIYSMRATGAPQFHLLRQVPSINAEQTLEPFGPTLLRDWAMRYAEQDKENKNPGFWSSYLRSQGVRHRLSWSTPESSEDAPDLTWSLVPGTPPAVWMVDRWKVNPRLVSNNPATLTADLVRCWFDGQQVLDCPQEVVLDETPSVPIWATKDVAVVEVPSGLVEWKFTAREKSAYVRALKPSVLVWRQLHDPGWHAQVIDEGGKSRWLPTVPAQRFLTAHLLPTGNYHVRLVYFPMWYWVGGPLTLVAWCWLLLRIALPQKSRGFARRFRILKRLRFWKTNRLSRKFCGLTFCIALL